MLEEKGLFLTIQELKILIEFESRWDNYEHQPYIDLISKIEKFLKEENYET